MIRGRTVTLRPVEDEDAALIHRWVNHPEVWRYMDYEAPASLSDVRDDIARSRTEGQPFTILVGDRPIGRIGLNNFRRRDRICGFYLFVGEPDFWGQGYARDAAMTLLGYAFDRMDLARVELWTLADNNRAVTTYQKCGFLVEATLPERSFKDGGWVDHVVMSATRGGFHRAMRAWETQGGSSPDP